MIEDCTAVILAGGESKRMGQDKSAMTLAGDTLLNRVIQHIQPHFAKVMMSLREPSPHFLLPQVCDQGVSQGPIMGIAAAMEQADTAWVFVIACDMPFASLELMQAMAEQRHNHQAVVPQINGVMQPLFAFYAAGCLPILQAQITQGNRSLKAAIAKLDAHICTENQCAKHDPTLLSFFDLDTQEDVIKAESILKKRGEA